MAESKIAGPMRCSRCGSRRADMVKVDIYPGGTSEFHCEDELACAARIEEQAEAVKDASRRVVVTKPAPAEDAHESLLSLIGDGRCEDLRMGDGIEELIERRVVCIQNLLGGMGPSGAFVTMPVGPNGTLLAVFHDGYLLRNLAGKPVFVSADRCWWVEEA